MKKKTGILIRGRAVVSGALAAAAVFILAACAPVTGPEVSGLPPGKGLVNIRLGIDGDPGPARTLVPDSVSASAFSSYKLIFTSGSDTISLEDQTGLTEIVLNAGTYTLNLTAYTGTGAGKKEAAAGTAADIVVSNGATTNKTVPLVFKPGAGDGTLSFTVTRPSAFALSGAEFTLNPLPPGGTTYGTDWLKVLYTDYGSGIPPTHSSNEPVSAGFYLATVTLSTPEREAVKSDIVHIGVGQTTTLNWAFVDADFSTVINYIRLVGIPSWGTTAPDTVAPSENPDGTYTWLVNAAANAAFRFILDDPASLTGDKWKAKWFHPETDGTNVSAAGSYEMRFTEGKPDLAWKLESAGWYGLTVNPYAKTLAVQPHTTPAISNAAIANTDKDKLALTFSEAVTISGDAPYGFTLTGTTALSITGATGSGTNYTFTLNREAIESETITLGYSGDAVKSVAAQIPLAPAAGQAVTNNVKAYPVITSATIENAQKNGLVLVFSKPVAVSGPTGFTLTGSPAINITGVSGADDTWTFTLSRNATSGETISLSYSGNTVTDTVDGNQLKPVTTMAVTNNVGLAQLPAPAQPSLSDDGVASWSGLDDETNAAKYEVQLYKGGSIQGTAAQVDKGDPYSHDFRSEIISGGAGAYTVKVKAIATAAAADSSASTASAVFTVTPLTLARLTWIGADTASLSANDTIESGGSFAIPVGKALIIGTGTKITAGKLELGEGTWKASGTNFSEALISPDTIALDLGVQLGSDGSNKTHLGGNGSGAASYTASIPNGVVVLKQNSDGLEISTPNTEAKLVMDTNALLHVKVGEILTIGADAVLETGAYLDIGEGSWKAIENAGYVGVTITPNQIQLGNHGYAAFGYSGRTVLGVNNSNSVEATNTYTASGDKITLGQDGTNLTVTGASTAAVLTMGATTDIYVSGGLIVDKAQISIPAGTPGTPGTPGGQIRVVAGQILSIANGGNVSADLLELSTGTWKATATTVTVKASQITMDSGTAWNAKFGKDDGAAATVLASPFEDGKNVSDTGWSATGAKVSLIQDGNNLAIKGASAEANFYVWKTGGIWVKAGLTIDTVTVNMDDHLPNNTSWTSAIYMRPGSTVAFPNTNSKIKVYAGEGTQEFDHTWWGKASLVTLGANIRMKRVDNSDHRVTDIYVSADGTGDENKLTNVHNSNDFWIARGFNHDGP